MKITKRNIVSRQDRLEWGREGRIRYLLQRLGWRVMNGETYTIHSRRRHFKLRRVLEGW